MVAVRYEGAYREDQAHILGRARGDALVSAHYGVLYAPGGGGLETSWQEGTNTNPNEAGDALRLAAAFYRFTSLATDWTWGNDEVISRLSDLHSYSRTSHHFRWRVHLLGASMGVPCILNWAVRNPKLVASIAGLIPAVDIQDIEDNHRVAPYGLPEPSSAYGERPPDAYNPRTYASELRGIPIKLWYSANDTVCVPETVEAFAEASGAELVNLGDQDSFIPGHGLNSNFNPADVVRFFAAHNR